MNFFADEKINLSTEHVEPVYTPKPPDRLNDLDIPQVIVEDLLLRYLYTKGSGSIRLLCDSIKLPFSLIHDIFQNLRKQQLFEVTGMEGNDYNFIASSLLHAYHCGSHAKFASCACKSVEPSAGFVTKA